jgi:hypothetical protein
MTQDIDNAYNIILYNMKRVKRSGIYQKCTDKAGRQMANQCDRSWHVCQSAFDTAFSQNWSFRLSFSTHSLSSYCDISSLGKNRVIQQHYALKSKGTFSCCEVKGERERSEMHGSLEERKKQEKCPNHKTLICWAETKGGRGGSGRKIITKSENERTK